LAIAVLIAACAAWGQPAPPSFEVASVKSAPSGQPHDNRRGVGTDRIEFRYATLWYCISYAYGMKSYQMSGPDWLRNARYDIVAKGPAGTAGDQLPKMMQALLADRLKVQVHHEKKEISGLALVVGKNGSKLKKSAAGPGDAAGEAHFAIGPSAEGVERMEATNVTMAKLANTLTGLLGRPVIDKTGLAGQYDFALEFSRAETAGPGASGGFNEPPRMPAPPAGAEPAQSIYTSIQQLGLKLDGQKFPIDSIVIDRAEKIPTEN
jgi:uncharacterized protein (TIGR03435 family)